LLTVSWTKLIRRNAKKRVNNTPRFVDLHVHTNFSDSSLSPQEVVSLAQSQDIAAVAITDHDCIDGIVPATDAAKNNGVEIIPGVELTAEIGDTEIHLLGLFIDIHADWLKSTLDKITAVRKLRMLEMIARLNKLGIPLTLDEVVFLSNSQASLGRLHLARALVSKKIIGTVQEAFARFIGRNKPCYVKRLIMAPEEAIDIVRRARGIAVFAHPGICNRDDLIPRLVAAGLRGIEVMHTDHSTQQEQYYRGIAQKRGLVVTGGSDCHGICKGKPLLGSVKMPYDTLEKIREVKRAEYGCC